MPQYFFGWSFNNEKMKMLRIFIDRKTRLFQTHVKKPYGELRNRFEIQ